MPDRETWLHGWPRNGTSVNIGSGWFCAGCGRFEGTGCVVVEDTDVLPSVDPDWPFDEETCPVCELRTALYSSPVPEPPPPWPRGKPRPLP
jgi:hypothetical protein